MALKVKGVKITNIALFRQYFDFNELLESIQQSEYNYKMFTGERAWGYLYGPNQLDGTPGDSHVIALLSTPERCTQVFAPYFYKYTDSVCGIHVEELVGTMKRTYGNVYCASTGELPAGFPADVDFAEETRRFLTDITAENANRFSMRNAVVILLYLLLHTHAALSPNRPESLRQLKQILLADAQTNGHFPFYDGSAKNDDALKIHMWENPETSTDVKTIHIEGTALSRSLYPGEKLYAVCKGHQFVSFLPRVSVSGKMLLYTENTMLLTRVDNASSYFEPQICQPACWSHINEYGTFVLDAEGRLHEELVWLEDTPEDVFVSVSACGVDYAMLNTTGSVYTRLKKHGWEHLIYASIGMNGGIAINEHRQAILCDGTVLPMTSVVEAHASYEHYICLDTKGQILTDSGYSAAESVYAVAITRDGYVLALREEIHLISFENVLLHRWTGISADEVAASGDVIAYYDTQKRTVEILYDANCIKK